MFVSDTSVGNDALYKSFFIVSARLLAWGGEQWI